VQDICQHKLTSTCSTLLPDRNAQQQQVAECARRAAKKILAKLKGGRPNAATLAELITGDPGDSCIIAIK